MNNFAESNLTDLLLLAHATRCGAKQGGCKHVGCLEMKVLWCHIHSCNKLACNVRHCLNGKVLLKHCARCHDRDCALCVPVRVAAKEEHWEGVKRKLSFTDVHCKCTTRKLAARLLLLGVGLCELCGTVGGVAALDVDEQGAHAHATDICNKGRRRKNSLERTV